jgi:hypothetical protein
MRSPPNPERSYIRPQADRLQNPNANGNDDNHVQDSFDAGSHRNVSVDQIQGHSNYDQHKDKIH